MSEIKEPDYEKELQKQLSPLIMDLQNKYNNDFEAIFYNATMILLTSPEYRAALKTCVELQIGKSIVQIYK